MISIDHREKQSIVPKELGKLGTPIEFTNLDTGDYIINNSLCIERKNSGDYISSLIEGRLNNELFRMSQNFPVSALLVEGFVSEILLERQVTRQSYLSSLAGVCLKRADIGARGVVSIIMVENPYDTSLLLHYLDKKMKGEKVRYLLPPKFVDERGEYYSSLISMYACFPKVGLEKAKALAKKFDSLEKLIGASKQELRQVEGFGDKLTDVVFNWIHSGRRKME